MLSTFADLIVEAAKPPTTQTQQPPTSTPDSEPYGDEDWMEAFG